MTNLFKSVFEQQRQKFNHWEMWAVFKPSQMNTDKHGQKFCKLVQVAENKAHSYWYLPGIESMKLQFFYMYK